MPLPKAVTSHDTQHTMPLPKAVLALTFHTTHANLTLAVYGIWVDPGTLP